MFPPWAVPMASSGAASYAHARPWLVVTLVTLVGCSDRPVTAADGTAGASGGSAATGTTSEGGHSDGADVGSTGVDVDLGGLGDSSGSTTEPPPQQHSELWLQGVEPDERAGISVRLVGDVDGDGYDDILVGARGDVDPGHAYLVYGAPDLPPVLSLAQADVRFEDVQPSRLGTELAGVGDVDADGYADLFFAATTPNPQELTEAFLVLGGPELPAVMSLPDTAIRFDAPGTSENSFLNLSLAGDVNGDGYDDLLLGAAWGYPDCDVAPIGYLVLGRPELPPVMNLGDADAVFWSGADCENFGGGEVRGAGDVDADGYADVLLAIGRYSDDEGVVHILYGGPQLPESMGVEDFDVALGGIAASPVRSSAAGDVDGDGYGDIFIGVPWASEAFLVRGEPSLPATADVADVAAVRLIGLDDSCLGNTIAGAGDIDGDGYDDLILGSREFESEDDQVGVVNLVHGRTVWPPMLDLASADVRLSYDKPGETVWLCTPSVHSGHDVDGDGRSDLAVGLPWAAPNRAEMAGEVNVIFSGLAWP